MCLTTRIRLRCTTILASLVIYVVFRLAYRPSCASRRGAPGGSFRPVSDNSNPVAMHDDFGSRWSYMSVFGWPTDRSARPAVARLVEDSDPCLTTRIRLPIRRRYWRRWSYMSVSGWPIVCSARPAVARLVEVSDPCLTTRIRLRCTTILASLVIYVGFRLAYRP